MPNLNSPEAAFYLLALTVPAVVFMYARIQFTHGRMPKASEAVLHYLAITAIYYGVAYPIILAAVKAPGNEWTWWAGWLTLLFFAPAGLGFLAGWVAQRGMIYDLARRLGFKPIHIIPTAWEWRFSKCPGEWVVVTLKNGNAYGAECGDGSFISTEPGERDIYLECTYDIGLDGVWEKRAYGMLISAGEISTIEFSLDDSSDSHGENTVKPASVPATPP